MFKRIFFLGLTAGIMASAAAVIFQRIHQFATYTDFSKIVNVPVLLAINIGVCMLASVLFFLLQKLSPGRKGRFIFNLIFVLISFMSITWSFALTLPLDAQFPELFPGLTVPMHFFPALAWFTFEPLFIAGSRHRGEEKKQSIRRIKKDGIVI
ncbi:hypothetical protein [Flavitalea sp.]|nr:hypothetical protein [Flavitalea sp.]